MINRSKLVFEEAFRIGPYRVEVHTEDHGDSLYHVLAIFDLTQWRSPPLWVFDEDFEMLAAGLHYARAVSDKANGIDPGEPPPEEVRQWFGPMGHDDPEYEAAMRRIDAQCRNRRKEGSS